MSSRPVLERTVPDNGSLTPNVARARPSLWYGQSIGGMLFRFPGRERLQGRDPRLYDTLLCQAFLVQPVRQAVLQVRV